MKQPKEYDVVLGGNNPPLNALVLGGIEGIKHRFANADSDEEKIAILREALKYGEEGEEFLSDVFSASKGKIQWMAAAFISATSNETYKELLVDYFIDIIFNNTDNWNNWKQELPDIQIHLKNCKIDYPSIYSQNPNIYFHWRDRKQTRIDLSNANLINSNLKEQNFSESNFNNADLCQANLTGIVLRNANLNSAKFIGTNLCGADLNSSNLNNTKFIDANLYCASLDRANLSQVDFTKANLKDCTFNKAQLDNTKFKFVSFNRSHLSNHSEFYETRLQNIVFKNIDFYDTCFEGSWLENVSFINCNLYDVCFVGIFIQETVVYDNCNLIDADFSHCHYKNQIKQVFLKNSNLENAIFKLSNLKGFVFENVNLKGVDFRWCDLTGIDFTGLDVRGANFTRCTFGNNNLDKANTEGAKFSSIDSPRFPPKLDTSKLEGALFDDRHYYEPGYE